MASNGIITKQFFGLHIGNGGQYWPTKPICGSWRSWDQIDSWRKQQTTSGGAINWTNTDAAINAAYAKGVDLVVTFGLTPTAMALATVVGNTIIGSGNPTNSFCPYGPAYNSPPQNLNDWIAYVAAFGSRYAGKVKYYEIWNEINDTEFFSGTIGGLSESPSPGTVNYGPGSDMYNLVKSASIALKAIDPTIKILSPSGTGGNNLPMILPLLQDLVAGNYIDIISYHFYSGGSILNNSLPDTTYNTMGAIQNFFSVLKTSTIPAGFPVWNTEYGYEYLNAVETGISRPAGSYLVPEGEMQNAFIMRSYIIAAAFGIQRSFWYTFDNGAMGMIEAGSMGDGVTGDTVTHKSCVGAFLTLQYWLTGRRVSDMKYDQGNGTWYVKVTDSNGFNGMLVWNATINGGYYKPPAGYTRYQWYGLQYIGGTVATLLGNGNNYANTWQTSAANIMQLTGGTGGASSVTLTVTAGSILPGVALSGTGVTAGAYVLPFGTNSTTGSGGVGTYALSTACNISAGTIITAANQNGPMPIDPPLMQMLPNPVSLIEGLPTMAPYGLSSGTYSPPNTFTVVNPNTPSSGTRYYAGHTQYSGYGIVTNPITSALIQINYTPIMLLA